MSFSFPPFIQKIRAVRKGSPRRSLFLEDNSRRGGGPFILLCERLQGPFVPSGVVTSSGPTKSSQDDAQRTRRPFPLPPVRRRFVAASASSSVPLLFFLPGNTGRGNTGKGCRWFYTVCFFEQYGGKVEGFRPRVYAPLFSSVRLLFAVRLLCGFASRLRPGSCPREIYSQYGGRLPGAGVSGWYAPRVSFVRPLFNAFLFAFPLCSYFRLCGPARPSCGFRQRVTDRRPGRARSGRRNNGGASPGHSDRKRLFSNYSRYFFPVRFFSGSFAVNR